MKTILKSLLVLALCAPIAANGVHVSTPTNATSVHVYAPILQAADQGNPNVKVWVNTASGVYHCPGTRWYGRTKQGEYMTQAEARKKGHRPAYGRVCR